MPSEFTVVAIVAAFNEADVIGPVVSDLIEQGLQVYVLDDGSTDGTVAAVEPFVGRGVLAIERLRAPAAGEPPPFDWEGILRRKAELAAELDADWFIHHDADEFRESPWPHLSLNDAIRSVDALGFNAIDFLSLDFWPVHDRFRAGDDVRTVFTGWSKSAPYDRLQIRCWKKTAAPVDLASSGGHEASFAGRHVFPMRFILRHYPIRGQAHGERKVWRERRRRLRAEERARGWHVQYDDVREDTSFIRDAATLTPYDGDAVRIGLALRHRGVEALEASLQAALDRARADLDAERLEVERRDAEIERTRIAWERKADEATALHRELGEQNARAAAQDSEVRHLTEALARRTAEVERLERAGQDLTRRIDELQRSLSWRSTAWLRAIGRMVRGR
jgi:hypothetical protein